MHQVKRWEPFADSDEFFRAFASPFFGRWTTRSDENGERPWLPAVDIRESRKEYCVIAELPGIRREDVKVRLEDDVLTLEGERKIEKEAGEDEQSHRVERFYGSFQRRFTLPNDSDPRSIRAEAKDGVLTVHIPKRQVEKPKSREIAVQ